MFGVHKQCSQAMSFELDFDSYLYMVLKFLLNILWLTGYNWIPTRRIYYWTWGLQFC